MQSLDLVLVAETPKLAQFLLGNRRQISSAEEAEGISRKISVAPSRPCVWSVRCMTLPNNPAHKYLQLIQHRNIPNLEESFWSRSWGARNKTHWYARNLMRNVAYYSESAPDQDPEMHTAEDDAFALEEAKNNKKKRY